jgi:hypothetical protein
VTIISELGTLAVPSNRCTLQSNTKYSIIQYSFEACVVVSSSLILVTLIMER